jgi:outer membrane usher protein
MDIAIGCSGLRRRWRPAMAALAMLAMTWPSGALAAWSGAASMPAAKLYLELIVNQRASGDIVPVEYRDGRYYVRPDDLRRLHVSVPQQSGALVALDALAQVQFDYDGIGQRMNITVPPQWLPQQYIGGGGGGGGGSAPAQPPFVPARSDVGALLNYDVYATMPALGPASVAVWNEWRLFGRLGRIASTGVIQRNGDGSGNVYRRYDSNWIYSDQARALTWSAGDLVTPALAWSNPVRIAGVQIARNFSVRPDLLTYPMPQIAGQAAVPSTVDLFINGYKAGSSHVQPGPFAMTNVPFINGAGSATLVTTDALGRQVSTTLPFYVSSQLLKPGWHDYAASVGALRRDYGLSNFSYGRAVATAYWRYGASDAMTVETRLEAADGLGLFGIGALHTLGRFGIANLALTNSRNGRQDARQPAAQAQAGHQLSLGYRYDAGQFHLGWQHAQRSAAYADLSSGDIAGYQLSRRSDQLAFGVGLGKLGNLGAGYFDIRAADGSRNRLFSLSHSTPLGAHATLFASVSIGAGSHGAQLQLLMPIGASGTLSTSHASSGSGDQRSSSRQLAYSQTMPIAGGIGGNVAVGSGGQGPAYRQMSLNWRNDVIGLGAGLYGTPGKDNHWAEAAGSVIVMDGSAFAANRVNDAFTLVSTGGMADVGVRYENQEIGRTDRNGHLLVPWASAYYAAKYEIDTLRLPPAIRVDQAEQRIAVAAGGGALLRFKLTQISAASIGLVDPDGKPIKLGSVALHRESGVRAPVGWDGLVYFDQLSADNHLALQLADGKQCTAHFALPPGQARIAHIKAVPCQ